MLGNSQKSSMCIGIILFYLWIIVRGIAKEMLDDIHTLGVEDLTDPVLLQVFRFWYCLLLQLAKNSNPTELHNTENEFLVISTVGNFFSMSSLLWRSCALALDSRRRNTDALPMRHCGRLLMYINIFNIILKIMSHVTLFIIINTIKKFWIFIEYVNSGNII